MSARRFWSFEILNFGLVSEFVTSDFRFESVSLRMLK